VSTGAKCKACSERQVPIFSRQTSRHFIMMADSSSLVSAVFRDVIHCSVVTKVTMTPIVLLLLAAGASSHPPWSDDTMLGGHLGPKMLLP
jgi:hypothetical protein